MKKFSKSFWRWFGNSKVVDENGDPLVVCHASRSEFKVFNIPDMELGVHFGTSSQCNQFKRSFNRQFYLSIQNPFVLIDSNTWTAPTIARSNDISKKLYAEIMYEHEKGGHRKSIAYLRNWFERNGFDGVVYLNRQEGITDDHFEKLERMNYRKMSDEEVLKIAPEAEFSYIVWHNEQIKRVEDI